MSGSGAYQTYNLGRCDVRFEDAVRVGWMTAMGAKPKVRFPVRSQGPVVAQAGPRVEDAALPP